MQPRGRRFLQRHLLLWQGYGNSDDADYDRPNVVLHHFEGCTDDQYPHDHGRNVASLILCGGYTEKVWLPGGEIEIRTRLPGSMTQLNFDQRHQLSGIQPDTWTIFLVGPQVREYQLYVGDQVMPKREVWDEGSSGVVGVHQDTPEFRARIAKRKRAVERLRGRHGA